jgi:hypothetical protein
MRNAAWLPIVCLALMVLPVPRYAQGASPDDCKVLDQNAKRCMFRAVTIDSLPESGVGGGHSGQAGAFRDCYNLYCRVSIIAGCSTSDTCKYGLPPGQAQIECRANQHLFYPGPGKPRECQDNAQGSGTPLPKNESTITGPDSDWCKTHGNFERPNGTRFCAE